VKRRNGGRSQYICSCQTRICCAYFNIEGILKVDSTRSNL
jgi:hypothetical protein